jgi:hypothetical protein
VKSLRIFSFVTVAIAALGIFMGAAQMPAPQGAPQYDADGKLIFPADYREWVFLSSGLDMSYSPKAPADGSHMFNNVFVPRAAYESFLKNGVWPDKTVLLLENRGGATNLSILKHGQIQTGDIMGLEVHVKDAKFKGGWAFFSYDDDKKPAQEIAHTASCYSCHEAHGAADTTFVQFYPTLLPAATNLKTLSAAYLAETAPK